MITKFMTEVTAKFNPFSPCAKPARLFLTQLPPNARANGMKITSTLLPKGATEPSSVYVKFSAFSASEQSRLWQLTEAEDGQEMKFACDKTNIIGLTNECDRHSRALQKKDDLQD